MVTYSYGNDAAPIVLIQMVDDHDLEFLEREVELIREKTDKDFRLIAMKVDDWNAELSPWNAPAVFGKEGFAGGAENSLEKVLELCEDDSKTYLIGGYSLSALFALWASYQTERFAAVAAASPSMWFPGFLDYMKSLEIQSRAVYLSLGDREEKTRNPVMATVGDCIRGAEEWLKAQGISCTLEWNEGNHFKDADVRTAKAFVWALEHTE